MSYYVVSRFVSVQTFINHQRVNLERLGVMNKEACRLVLLQCLQMSLSAASLLSKESDKSLAAYKNTLLQRVQSINNAVSVV